MSDESEFWALPAEPDRASGLRPQPPAASSRSSIPSAAKLAASLTNNMAGELLREVCFAERFGAYSCFELRDGFRQICPFSLSKEVRTALLGWYANTPAEVESVSAYHHNEADLTVAWHWDGDGTLVFARGGFLIHNSDCKKDYGWERHGPGDWIATYENYEDPASAIEARRNTDAVHESAVGEAETP